MSETTPPQGLLEVPARLLLPATGGLRHLPARSLIGITGPDAVDFLQRICSQEVAALGIGDVAPAAFLSSKGKLVATALAIRGADGILLDTQASSAAALLGLCELYHFSERLQIASRADLIAVELVSAVAAADRMPMRAEFAGATVRLALARGGVFRDRVFAPADALHRWFDAAAPLDAARAECLRIGSGEIDVGRDTDERTLVLEAGLDDHVSLDKGCYVGQEIVARIHTYGHLNRRLVRLAIATTEAIAKDTPLVDIDADEAVGRVTTACRIPDLGWSLALGYLPEAFLQEPSPLALGDAAGPRAHHAGLVPA